MAQHASDTQFHNVHPALFAMVIVFLAGILLTAVNTVCLLAFTLRGTSAQAVSALIEIGLGIIIAVLYRRKTGVRLGFSSKGLLTGLLYALPVIALAAMSLTSDVSQWVDAGYPPDAGLIGLGALVALSAGLYEEITYRAMIVGGVSQATGRGRFWTGIAIFASAALFGATHIVNLLLGVQGSDVTFAQMIYTLALGFVWAAVYVRTHNLWATVCTHTLIDFAAFVAPTSIAGGGSGASSIDAGTDFTLLIVQLCAFALMFLGYALFVIRPGSRAQIDEAWEQIDDACTQIDEAWEQIDDACTQTDDVRTHQSPQP